METAVPLIRYIGRKPVKTDNVCKTDAVWNGHGADVEVPRDVAVRLLAHPDIWALAEAIEVEARPPPEDDDTAVTALRFTHEADDPLNLLRLRDTESDEIIDLAQMDDATLKTFTRTSGLRVDLRKKGDELRSLIVATVIHLADPKE